MRRPGALALAAALAWLGSPGTAEAHIVAARLGDFYAGMLHPLTDLEDVILWSALGLLAGSLGPRLGRWLVLVFPLGLLAGLAAARLFGIDATAPIVPAGAMLLVGLLIAIAVPLPLAALVTLAALVAIVRGIANAGGAGPGTNLSLFAAGLAASGYVAITLVTALTVLFLARPARPAAGWRDIAVRACGSWIAAIGLMIGGYALAL